MTKRAALNDSEMANALTELNGWSIEDGKLHKTFIFKSFKEALGWMVSVGLVAEKMDHHPEWSNVYNRVTVNLVTHDMDNSVSTWDVALAKEMDALAG